MSVILKFRNRKTGEVVTQLETCPVYKKVDETDKGVYLVLYRSADGKDYAMERVAFIETFVALQYHCGACSESFETVDELLLHLKTCKMAAELSGVLDRMRGSKDEN